MKNLSIALDWSVNTNHSGFIIAKEMGFYNACDLEVNIITPEADNYAITPAKKLENGEVDFALCPLESILSYRTKTKPFKAKAIATLFTEDLSSIVTLQGSEIVSPKDLDNKIYASYNARYEDLIVRQMIQNDGGTGAIKISYPPKLGIWNTLVNKQADATWIFDNWEGVKAKNAGLKLTSFKLQDYGIPYGYSPVIIASESALAYNRSSYQDFLKATKAGFLFAQANAEKTVDILMTLVPEAERDYHFLLESQVYSSKYYGDEESWGKMERSRVQQYLDWIFTNQLEAQQFSPEDVVTNDLL